MVAEATNCFVNHIYAIANNPFIELMFHQKKINDLRIVIIIIDYILQTITNKLRKIVFFFYWLMARGSYATVLFHNLQFMGYNIVFYLWKFSRKLGEDNIYCKMKSRCGQETLGSKCINVHNVLKALNIPAYNRFCSYEYLVQFKVMIIFTISFYHLK